MARLSTLRLASSWVYEDEIRLVLRDGVDIFADIVGVSSFETNEIKEVNTCGSSILSCSALYTKLLDFSW